MLSVYYIFYENTSFCAILKAGTLEDIGYGILQESKGEVCMSIQFENKETEDYYKKMRRNLGVGHPSSWDSQDVVTMQDVEQYVKDAKNILAC